jgi:hypothetical protein
MSDIPSRIKLVAAKINQQNLKAFGKEGATKLPAADAEALFGWYDALIKQKENKIRRSAAVVYINTYKEQRGENPPTSELEAFKRRPLSQLVGFIFKYDRKTINPMIQDQDISRLKNLLSSEANSILDAGFSAAERTRLIINWIDAANQYFPRKTAHVLQWAFGSPTRQTGQSVSRRMAQRFDSDVPQTPIGHQR